MHFSDDQIKYMVDRFLGWRLPENFSPDAGISFKAAYNEHTAHPAKHEPTGTNLFDAAQATEMVRYMVESLRSPPVSVASAELGQCVRDALHAAEGEFSNRSYAEVAAEFILKKFDVRKRPAAPDTEGR
jgi:hypothetical protein